MNSTATDRLDAIEHRANAALQPLHPDARMDAYYYGFERTGIHAVDRVLSAVAVAGKGLHSTMSWADTDDVLAVTYWQQPPVGVEPADCAADMIQATAERASKTIRAALADVPALVAAIRGVLALCNEADAAQTDGLDPSGLAYRLAQSLAGVAATAVVRTIESALAEVSA